MHNAKNILDHFSIAKNILDLLKTKHVVLEGGDSNDRDKIVEYIRVAVSAKYSIFEVPYNISNMKNYFDAIRVVFPLMSPLGIKVSEMNNNQIEDTQLDWIEFQEKDTFIIWNEMIKFDDISKLYHTLDQYVSLKYYLEEEKYNRAFRLLVNSNFKIDNYYQCAQLLYPSQKEEPVEKKVRDNIVIYHIPSRPYNHL